MIFISGIHGVGKSYFCEEVKNRLGINAYSASALISELKNELFNKDKLIADIDKNQGYLLAAVKKLDEREKIYLLDGHFCLLNAQGEVQRISLQTFLNLKPQGIVLLTKNPEVVVKRRKTRDGIEHDKEKISTFQNEEVAYAEEISLLMGIPLYISQSANDIENAIKFIDTFAKGDKENIGGVSMAGKFQLSKFSEIDITDSFFEPLKSDYPEDEKNIGFEKWFKKKSREGAVALVFNDDEGIGAFVCLKDENEPLILADEVLPAIPRKKISTLRLAERYRGQRLGEGAIGLALWNWQKSNQKEIYVTVFEKHDVLIDLLKKFGFEKVGYNKNGECVFLRSRDSLDYSNPYKSFPFINPSFEKGGYLIVDDVYHDTLFPYSELKNTIQEQVALSVANGISKIYIGSPYNRPHYQTGEPILIYRKHTKSDGQKPKYKSCLTSYCIVTDIVIAKERNRKLIPVEDLLRRISNKSVYDENNIRTKYENEKNLVIIEMLYYGFFGEGHNINYAWLTSNGFFASGVYPTQNRVSPEQFKILLSEGDKNVSNVIID